MVKNNQPPKFTPNFKKQGGPRADRYNWDEITPISRVLSAQLSIYFRPFIGFITPPIASKGPPCRCIFLKTKSKAPMKHRPSCKRTKQRQTWPPFFPCIFSGANVTCLLVIGRVSTNTDLRWIMNGRWKFTGVCFIKKTLGFNKNRPFLLKRFSTKTPEILKNP